MSSRQGPLGAIVICVDARAGNARASFVGQIFTCTFANVFWLRVDPKEYGIVCIVSSGHGQLVVMFECTDASESWLFDLFMW